MLILAVVGGWLLARVDCLQLVEWPRDTHLVEFELVLKLL
jgi:hypothetical protein